MKVSHSTLKKIMEWEGFRSKPYLCPAGVLTIGYGHTSAAGRPEVRYGMSITRAEAEAILERDVQKFTNQLMPLLKRRPTQGQLDGMVSLAFNIGLGAFKKSTCLRRFNAGNIMGAAEALTWFNKATVNGVKKTLSGLVNRREQERAIFLSDYTVPAHDAQDIRGDMVTGGEHKPLAKSKTATAGVVGAVTGGLSLWGEFKESVPEVVQILSPALLVVAIGVCVFVVWNRRREAKAGEH